MAQQTNGLYENYPPRSSRFGGCGWIILMIVSFLVLCCCISSCFWVLALMSSAGSDLESGVENYRVVAGEKLSGNKLLSINISGPINTNAEIDDSGASLLGGSSATYGYQVKDRLMRAAKDDSIKGVILEINSPGGTVTGSNAISDGIKFYREQTKKPVYAHVSGMAASGAYWVAAATDRIISDVGSINGSIGVIYGPFKYYDKVLSEGSDLFGNVVTQNGIETSYFTAGGNKDFGSPYRRLTEEEVRNTQASVNNEYELFLRHVSERRKISTEVIRAQVKALIYDNKQALNLKLIDAVGNREDAYKALAEAAKVGDDYQIVKDRAVGGFLSQLFGAQSDAKEPVQARNSCNLCGQILFFHGDPSQY